MTSSASDLRLQVLHLEDNANDAELVRQSMLEEWPQAVFRCVQTKEDFLSAVRRGGFDVILSDFSLPQFDGLSALDLVRQHDTATPFIFISGTIGEDNAVLALRRGATDYVIKDRMGRLVPAIRRALDEVKEQRQRRQVEERMHEQAELLDKARDAIVVSDSDRRIVYWNQGAERIFGWKVAEVINRRAVDLFGPQALQEIETARELLAGSEWHGLVRLHDREGRALVLDSRVTVIRDEQGRPKSNLIISTDITEKQKLEQQLLRNQRLESIGTLAGGIAHDLNNVLAPILMSINLLQTKLADRTDIGRLLSVLESSAQHGAGLVRQILAFARGAEGQRTALDLRLVMREVTNLLSDTLPRNIAIAIECPPNLRLVDGDPTQLRQVLMNLCVNARDALPRGGNITLAAANIDVDAVLAAAHSDARPGPHVLLTVTDTGTGIPPEIAERIFDPFFTTKGEGKGTGLGLATVLGIVKGHGGFLQVDSSVGKGSSFRLFFPAATCESEKTALPVDATLQRASGETVLVVDDEAAVREFIRALLEIYGYRALIAPDGLSGLALFHQHRNVIAAVITDLVMPGMSGSDFIKEVRQIAPAVGIVVISGMPNEEPLVLEQTGRTVFLAKPMTGDKLWQALQQVVSAAAAGPVPR